MKLTGVRTLFWHQNPSHRDDADKNRTGSIHRPSATTASLSDLPDKPDRSPGFAGCTNGPAATWPVECHRIEDRSTAAISVPSAPLSAVLATSTTMSGLVSAVRPQPSEPICHPLQRASLQDRLKLNLGYPSYVFPECIPKTAGAFNPIPEAALPAFPTTHQIKMFP